MNIWSRVVCVILCLGIGHLSAQFLPCAAAERKIDFNRDIRPILSDKCFACHGPDENKREAGLRLDTPDGMVAKLEAGNAAVVPGKLPESSLIARIMQTNPDEVM